MPPATALPLSEDFTEVDHYVDSLLDFVSSSQLFQTLCGGVHILDFFTTNPSLYDTVLPEDWRIFFAGCTSMELLDLCMRHDLSEPVTISKAENPPLSLLEYIKQIRRHSLARGHTPRVLKQKKLPHHVAVGMVPKKIHEVTNFASYVDALAEDIKNMKGKDITHYVDFGSGQNYLGRSLASPPYNKHIVAVESREINITGAQRMDVTAQVAKREVVMRNKKLYRKQFQGKENGIEISDGNKDIAGLSEGNREAEAEADTISKESANVIQEAEVLSGLKDSHSENTMETNTSTTSQEANVADMRPIKDLATIYTPGDGKGSIQYIEHRVENGDLSPVVAQVTDTDVSTNQDDCNCSTKPASEQESIKVVSKIVPKDLRLMAISIHSCGNLSHHGIQSLLLNPTVHAIAIVGCCYNLLTERLAPPTYKHPILRPNLRAVNARVTRESEACDPHGFPMSERVASHNKEGIRLNITARMMAVQAPYNWTEKESDSFFTRHYYRALLQKIFLDRGVVSKPHASVNNDGSESINNEGTDPVIIGSLRKSCYTSFTAYVRGALAKIVTNSEAERASFIQDRMSQMTDEEIAAYANTYESRKKELSVMWTLMAFSAGVVESLIVVDRWLFLKEHDDVVSDCWVESVFDYQFSPRNLVVVGVKR